MTRDQEIWGIALWVEKTHGANGWFYIAQQQDRLIASADRQGISAEDRNVGLSGLAAFCERMGISRLSLGELDRRDSSVGH